MTPTPIAHDIRPEDKGRVAATLATFYLHPWEAAIREYLTNGIDAHRAADLDAPVQVTLPTVMFPTLRIIDQGAGMDRDFVLNHYVRYGNSLSSEDPTKAGWFGYGSKSGFSVADVFTVTTTTSTGTTAITFGDAGVIDNQMGSVGDTVITGKPVGTEVSLPLPTIQGNGDPAADPQALSKALKEVELAALRVCYTFEPGTVTLDDKEPPNLWNDPATQHLGGGLFVRSARGGGVLTVVMGGVGYQASSILVDQLGTYLSVHYPDHVLAQAITDSAANDSEIYLVVPFGTIECNPNREGIKRTTDNVAAIAKSMATACDHVVGDVHDTLQPVLDAVAPPEQLNAAAKAIAAAKPDLLGTCSGVLSPSSRVVKLAGRAVISAVSQVLTASLGEATVPYPVLIDGHLYRDGTTIPASAWTKVRVVTGVPAGRVSTAARSWRRYSQDDLYSHVVLITSDTPASSITGHHGWLQWESRGRCVTTFAALGFRATPSTRKVTEAAGAEYRSTSTAAVQVAFLNEVGALQHGRIVRSKLTAKGVDCFVHSYSLRGGSAEALLTVAPAGAHLISPFNRSHTRPKHWNPMGPLAADALNRFSRDQRHLLRMACDLRTMDSAGWGPTTTLLYKHRRVIDDPDLRRVLALFHKYSAAPERAEAFAAHTTMEILAQIAGGPIPVTSQWKAVLGRYPLISHSSSTLPAEHLTTYINAVYRDDSTSLLKDNR